MVSLSYTKTHNYPSKLQRNFPLLVYEYMFGVIWWESLFPKLFIWSDNRFFPGYWFRPLPSTSCLGLVETLPVYGLWLLADILLDLLPPSCLPKDKNLAALKSVCHLFLWCGVVCFRTSAWREVRHAFGFRNLLALIY